MHMNKKTALLIGATGLIGSHLLALLLKDPIYREVRVWTRRSLAIKHDKLRQVITDFDRLAELEPELFGVEEVFCCLGTTIKKAGSKAQFRKIDREYPLTIAHMAKKAGVKQFLLVSALGANSQSPFFYNQVKGEVEEELTQVGFLSLHMFRPSLLLGKRQEFRFGEAIAGILSPVLSPLLVGHLRKIRPIKARIVAAAMHHAANYERSGVHIYESQEIGRMVTK